MVTDGANNTLSIRQGLPFPATPILDWFHISMKIRHVEQNVATAFMWRSREEAA
jgi:hypothetical protein